MDPVAKGGRAPDDQTTAPASSAPGSLAAQWDRVLTTPRGTRRARMSFSVALAVLVLLASVAAWQGFLHSAVAARFGSMNEIVFAGGKNLDSAASPVALPQLYVMHPDGSGLRQLTHLSDKGYFSPMWSPDGTHIAAYMLLGSTGVIAYLAVMDADGSHVRGITDNVLSLENFAPSSPDSYLPVNGLIAWSPDGSQLVAELSVGLYLLVNADGTHPHVFNALFPAWSPDGRYLAYYTNLSNPSAPQHNNAYTIALLDTQTFHTRLLTGLPGLNAEALAWSPDGRYLAVSGLWGADQFQSSDAVLLVHPDGTGLKLVAQWQNSQVQQIVWSPSSQQLAVVIQTFNFIQQGNDPSSSGSVLLVVNADGSHAHQVGLSDGSQPSWSPDGKHLIFASLDDTELLLADTSAQGKTAPRALTDSLSFLFAPCWSPLAGI